MNQQINLHEGPVVSICRDSIAHYILFSNSNSVSSPHYQQHEDKNWTKTIPTLSGIALLFGSPRSRSFRPLAFFAYVMRVAKQYRGRRGAIKFRRFMGPRWRARAAFYRASYKNSVMIGWSRYRKLAYKAQTRKKTVTRVMNSKGTVTIGFRYVN